MDKYKENFNNIIINNINTKFVRKEAHEVRTTKTCDASWNTTVVAYCKNSIIIYEKLKKIE